MIVAIHQPNYAPWLGYFVKIARSDLFVFLDDAQYSKNSYTNRAQIDAAGTAKWLTVPVSYSFGDPINRVRAADAKWRDNHLGMLRQYYGKAPAFNETWDFITKLYAALPDDNLARSNEGIIQGLAARLDLHPRFISSSSIEVGDARSTDRLILILQSAGSDVT